MNRACKESGWLSALELFVMLGKLKLAKQFKHSVLGYALEWEAHRKRSEKYVV